MPGPGDQSQTTVRDYRQRDRTRPAITAFGGHFQPTHCQGKSTCAEETEVKEEAEDEEERAAARKWKKKIYSMFVQTVTMKFHSLVYSDHC